MTHEPAAQIDPVVEAVQLLRLLSDPTRLRLLGLLQSGPMNVTTLCAKLDLAQPTVSHHTRILAEAGLIEGDKRGRWVHWSISEGRVEFVRRVLDP